MGALVALLLSAGLGAPLASAQPLQGGPAVAQARFDRGRELYQRNDYAGALVEFRAALEAFRSPNIRLYIGLCLSNLGNFAEAYTELQRTANEAADLAPQDRRYGPTRELAQQELQTLEPRIGRLTVRAPVAPDAMVVRVQGVELARPAWGVPVPYDPGNLTVEADAPGYQPFTQLVRIEAGGQHEVTVSLVAGRAPATDPERIVGRQAPPTAPVSRGGGVRTAGFVVGALGVAGAGAFVAFGLLARQRYDDLLVVCRNQPCPYWRESDIQTGEQYQLFANISLGVGAAGLLAGIIMIAAGGPTTESAPTAPVTAWADPSRGLVGVRGAF
ncbi:MAG: hypothetical protein HY909_12220 [Deltaproteobacteria bacterium]|nr:hypothetical protein [Deltaproteobacteria bacterium]